MLISHGPTGLGGWLPTGTRMALPSSTAAEYPNTQTPTYYPSQTPAAFIKAAASVPSVAAGAAGFYDDVVAYLKIDDLAHLAKLDARDWPEALQTATDIQNFSVATTSNLTNTATTNQFITTTVNTSPSSTEEFQQTTSSGGVAGGDYLGSGSSANPYSACLWWPNQINLYSPPTATTSTASWVSNVITFTTAASHNLSTGDTVIVTNASPSGYNGTYTVTATPTSTKFTVANAVNPGAWVSGGTIKRVSTLTGRTLTLTTGTSWSSSTSTITFTTATSHNLVVGDVITVTGASPSGYNGTYAVTSTPTSYTFTVAQASNPGAWTSGGTFTSGRFWSGGVITFTTTANHNYSVGTVVVVSGASPAGYDGTYTVTAVPSPTTFSVAQAVNPGNWVSGGTVTPGFRRTLIVSVEAAFNLLGSNTDAGGGVVLGFLPTDGYWVNASSPGAISLTPSLSITSASYSFGTITYTTSGQLPFVTGNTVTVSGMSYSNYNGTYTNIAVTGSNTFTVSSSWPGSSSSSGGTVTGTLCGSSSSSSRIGWENSSDGNLPTPRFGVEMDMQYSNTRNDPNGQQNHVAVDGSGVTHGSIAGSNVGSSGSATASCSNSSSTYATTPLVPPVSLASGTSWSGGVITFTTSTNHNLSTGTMITVTGASPSGYNGSYAITATPSSNSFTVAQPSNPGTWTSRRDRRNQ